MPARTKAPRATGWVLGTVVLGAALGAGSYFLAIGPVLDESSAARMQTESVVQANDIQRAKIARLKAQFAELDTYKAELAALRVQIPTDHDLSGYFRQLQEIATARGVTIVNVAAQNGQTVVPVVTAPTEVAEPTAAADPATPDPSADTPAPEAPEAPAAPAGPVVPEGFVAIPVSITTVGSYEGVLAFLADAQAATPRLFLVADFMGAAQDAAEPGGGRPATAVGDLELTVNGFVYVLQDSAAAAPVAPTEPAPLPGAVPGKNPLIPVGGGVG